MIPERGCLDHGSRAERDPTPGSPERVAGRRFKESPHRTRRQHDHRPGAARAARQLSQGDCPSRLGKVHDPGDGLFDAVTVDFVDAPGPRSGGRAYGPGLSWWGSRGSGGGRGLGGRWLLVYQRTSTTEDWLLRPGGYRGCKRSICASGSDIVNVRVR